MKNIYLNLLLILLGQYVFGQETRFGLFKGTVGKIPVTLFLKITYSECPSIKYEGMYKYDHISNWLQLEVSDDEDKRLVLVEKGLTGILSLKDDRKSLNGFWISPDGNKKLQVLLKEVNLVEKTKNELEDKFYKINYENNDC